MNNHVFKNVFLYICDKNGYISTVVNSLNEDAPASENTSIFEYILPDCKSIWESFLSESKDVQDYQQWKGFITRVGDETYACFLAFFEDNQIMVLGLKEDIQQYLYKEIFKINGQLTNKIRSLYKEKNVPQLDAYEEISKMNNELANARRELKKKNIELEELNLRLEQLSTKDVLTGLFNRRYFYLYTPDVVSRARRLKYSCSLIMVDINGFKRVNDNLGHDIGDLLLIHLSDCFNRSLRSGQDIVFRFGGDEFVILLETAEKDEAVLVMNRINELFLKDSKGTSLAAGIVEIPYDDIQEDFTDYIKKADQLMYMEKRKMKSM